MNTGMAIYSGEQMEFHNQIPSTLIQKNIVGLQVKQLITPIKHGFIWSLSTSLLLDMSSLTIVQTVISG